MVAYIGLLVNNHLSLRALPWGQGLFWLLYTSTHAHRYFRRYTDVANNHKRLYSCRWRTHGIRHRIL